jgi:hypothetical protein
MLMGWGRFSSDGRDTRFCLALSFLQRWFTLPTLLCWRIGIVFPTMDRLIKKD